MKKIGVLGTGTMGAGIIQVLAQNGYEVVMRARRESLSETIEASMAEPLLNSFLILRTEWIPFASPASSSSFAVMKALRVLCQPWSQPSTAVPSSLER